MMGSGETAQIVDNKETAPPKEPIVPLNLRENFRISAESRLPTETLERLNAAIEEIEKTHLQQPLMAARKGLKNIAKAGPKAQEAIKQELSSVEQALTYFGEFNQDFKDAALAEAALDEIGGIKITFTPKKDAHLGMLEKRKVAKEDGRTVTAGRYVDKVEIIIRTGSKEEAGVVKTPLEINYRFVDMRGQEIQSLRIDIHNIANVPREEQQVQVDATLGSGNMEIKHQVVQALPKGAQAVEMLRLLEYSLAFNTIEKIRARGLDIGKSTKERMAHFEEACRQGLAIPNQKQLAQEQQQQLLEEAKNKITEQLGTLAAAAQEAYQASELVFPQGTDSLIGIDYLVSLVRGSPAHQASPEEVFAVANVLTNLQQLEKSDLDEANHPMLSMVANHVYGSDDLNDTQKERMVELLGKIASLG